MTVLSILMVPYVCVSITLSILGYVDPGTGSIILQALIATVVGAGIAVKLFWHRILKFLGIRKSIEPDPTKKESDPKQ